MTVVHLDVTAEHWQFDPISQRWGTRLAKGRFLYLAGDEPAGTPLDYALKIAKADKITGTVQGPISDGHRQIFYFANGKCTDRHVTQAGSQL